MEQIESARKSYSLISDSLKNSMVAIDSLRALDIYRPDINAAIMMAESLKSSQSAINSLKASTMYHQDMINTATMMNESLSNSMSAIDSLRASTRYHQDMINSATMVAESLKSSQSAINSLKALDIYQNDLTNSMFLMRNNLEAIERISQEFNILKYVNIIDFISNLNLDLISQNYEGRFSGRYTKQFDLFIRNSGWLIPNCASEEFIDSLYSSFDNDENIDEKFVEYFSDNEFEVILELKEKWISENLIPKGNLNIISNALNLILNDNGQNYSDIIIPSLLAQIDILISQVLIKNGYTEKNRKFYSDTYGAENLGNIRTFRENFAENIIDNWEEHHVNFLLENLFANNDSDSETPLIINFNRHDIMHGLDNEYGTFENLIRCLLVIDFLNDFLSDELHYRLN